jgi:hypothetical protein
MFREVSAMSMGNCGALSFARNGVTVGGGGAGSVGSIGDDDGGGDEDK